MEIKQQKKRRENNSLVAAETRSTAAAAASRNSDAPSIASDCLASRRRVDDRCPRGMINYREITRVPIFAPSVSVVFRKRADVLARLFRFFGRFTSRRDDLLVVREKRRPVPDCSPTRVNTGRQP